MRNFAFLAVLFIMGCNPISDRKQPIPSLQRLAQMDLKLNGKQLAEVYCGNCHLQPKPEILDRATWENHVLPDMRLRMGLILAEDLGRVMPEDKGVPEGIYSEVPLIKEGDWEKLKEYYIQNAPATPNPQDRKMAPAQGIPGFNVEVPSFDFSYPSLTTLLDVDSSGAIWIGHRHHKLFQLDVQHGFRVKDSVHTPVAPVKMNWRAGDQFELLSMGLMDPANDSVGTLLSYHRKNEVWVGEGILEGLIRPVDWVAADLNGDGLEDLIVSQFGDHVGKLSVHYAAKDGSHREQVIKALPGARKVEVLDFDGDGDLDLIGLMTQAREGVFLWENKGNESFVENPLLEFHPAFGASDFQLKDMDQDGELDLILVNGDNADLSQVLKNYHGVRIFLNKDEGFVESWFYPMYGASGLEVDDFDGDGNQDIVVISFFPDKTQTPEESLIYFQGRGTMSFKPFVPDVDLGLNAMLIKKGDVDQDGDQDVLIGLFEFEDLFKSTERAWKPIVLLRNNSL